MKRTLQWKFIRTAMMAVTVLLLVLLGAINLLNWWQVERQTDWMLQVLTQGDAPPVEPKRPEGFLPPLDADDKGAARFFQVFYDGTGQVAYVDVNQIATVTKEEAVDYAAQCQGRDQGTIDRFEFRRVSVPDGQGERIFGHLFKPVVHSDGTGDFCRDGAAVLAGNLAAGGSPVSPGHCSPGPVNGKTAPVCHQCRP